MCPEYVLAAGFWLAVFPKKSLLWYTHKSTTWKLRIAEKQVDAIFTASTLSFRLPSKKVEVTGHGIDTEFFKPAPTRRKRTKLVILTVGRISPVKKHEVLIEAALFLKQEGADFEVRIAGAPIVEGDAKYQEALERIVKERALSNEVRFLGAVPHQEIVEFYRQGVIFINLSETGSLDKPRAGWSERTPRPDTIRELAASSLRAVAWRHRARRREPRRRCCSGHGFPQARL